MSKTIFVEYRLKDRLTTPLKKMQKSVDKFEKSLKSTDKLLTDIGRNKGFERASQKIEQKSERVTKKVQAANKQLSVFNQHLTKSDEKAKKAANSLDQLAKSQKELSATQARVNKTTLNQNMRFTAAADAANSLNNRLREMVSLEKDLTANMRAKNKEAKQQAKDLADVATHGARAERNMRSLNRQSKAWNDMKKAFNDQKDHNFFVEGFESGIKMFTTMKKIANILPFIGVAFGGLVSMVNGLAVGIGAVAGSVVRLSGALAVLPGLYTAIGVAAASAGAMNKTIFQPTIKGKESLTKLDQQLADAKLSRSTALANNAKTGSQSSINSVEKAENRIARLEKERTKIMQRMTGAAEDFNDELEKTKSAWTDFWWGKDNKRGDQILKTATRGLKTAQKLIKEFDPVADRAATSFSRLVDAFDRLSNNKLFKRNFTQVLGIAFKNFDKIVVTAENLAPVAAGIAKSAGKVTGEVLDQAMGWSDSYDNAKKVEEVTRRTERFFRQGVNSLKLWVGAIRSFATVMYDMVSPLTDRFESWLSRVPGRLDKWNKKMNKRTKPTGGVGPMGPSPADQYRANSSMVLGGLGEVVTAFRDVFALFGRSRKAAVATTDFLKAFAGGIRSFGGFALKATERLGPKLTEFFKAFGKAHEGSGDIIISMLEKILEWSTKIVKLWDKIPGNEKIFGFMVALSAFSTFIGSVAGGIAAPIAAGAGAAGMLGLGSAAAGAGVKGIAGGAIGTAAKGTARVAGYGAIVGTQALLAAISPVIAPVLAILAGGAALAGLITITAKMWKHFFPKDAQEILDQGRKERGDQKYAAADAAGISRSKVDSFFMNSSKGGAFGSLPKNAKDVEWAVKKIEGSKSLGGVALAAFITTQTSLPDIINKATGKSDKNLKTQGTKLTSTTNKTGRDVSTALGGWVNRVNSLFGSLGIATSTAAPQSTVTGGIGPPAPASMIGDSNFPAAMGDSNRPAAGGGGVTSGLSSAMGPAVSLAQQMGGTITSGLRPGAITSSGLPSDHGTGNAIDIAGSPSLMSRIAHAANRLNGVKQVIYSPVGWSRNGSPFSPVTDAAVKADHYDHVHVAMGGSGAGGGTGAAMSIPGVPSMGNTAFGKAVRAQANAIRDSLKDQVGGGFGASSNEGGTGGKSPNAARQIAKGMLGNFGFGSGSFGALDNLWTKESGWRWNADNPNSSAYGIPQSLPGEKMASSGADWKTNPATQIDWGLGYIKQRYGSPQEAWEHSQAVNWYGTGGDFIAKKPHVIGVGDKQERVTITPKGKPGYSGGGGMVVNVAINGGVFTNAESLKKLAEAVGEEVAKAMISNGRAASDEMDI